MPEKTRRISVRKRSNVRSIKYLAMDFLCEPKNWRRFDSKLLAEAISGQSARKECRNLYLGDDTYFTISSSLSTKKIASFCICYIF